MGRYGEPPNLILTIRRVGDHLSIQENGEPIQDLLPESERDFFSNVADDVITFESAGAGHATKLVLHTGGKDMSIKRIE